MDAKQVVVAYDFSATADVALEYAVDIATREPGNVLHFITVLDARKGIGLEPHPTVDFAYADKVQGLLQEKVRVAFERHGATGEPAYFAHARIGHAVHEVLELARDVGADLIVLGSHGRTGLRRLFLGSVSEEVVRHAECPVMVARPKRYAHIDLDKIIEVHREPGHRRQRHGTWGNRSKQVGPTDWPT